MRIMVELIGIHEVTGEEVIFDSPTFPTVEDALAFVSGLDPRQMFKWCPINPLPLPEEA